MSDQIILNSEHCSTEIADRAHAHWDPDRCVSIARVVNSQLYGGVIYADYTGESVVAHVAGWDAHWLSRDLLWIMFDYPFRQMRVKRIFAPIPADNYDALSFNRKLGFKVVNVIKGVYPYDVDCLLTCMERHECRFLKIKPRKIHSNLIEA
jgi:hypothetical protein